MKKENEHKIEITLNGEKRRLDHAITLSQLLELFELNTKKSIAIERNKYIVPRKAYPETMIANNDQIEVVTAFAGG